MENETYQTLHARITRQEDSSFVQGGDDNISTCNWRRQCGCIRTSEKLKQILETFPSPPPPSPTGTLSNNRFQSTCISAYCTHEHQLGAPKSQLPLIETRSQGDIETTKKTQVSNKLQISLFRSDFTWEDSNYISASTTRSKVESGDSMSYKSWQVVSELVQLVQLSVTATALALYYLIYCYMQLVYYTLRSALYFHNADGAMKITIAVVTVTSLVVGFNIVLRMDRLIGIFH